MNIESKAGYGVDLWGDIDCGTDISIFIAGCVRDYRNLVVACGDAGYDAFVVLGAEERSERKLIYIERSRKA